MVSEALLNSAMISEVFTASLEARPVFSDELTTCLAISSTDAVSSSAAAATVCTFTDACSDAAATLVAIL